jgi:hypothetical protein
MTYRPTPQERADRHAKEANMLWEDLTIALCAVGFVWVVALLLLELPAVLNPEFVTTIRTLIRG